jgi:mitogen-activated protein kinase kinase kinase
MAMATTSTVVGSIQPPSPTSRTPPGGSSPNLSANADLVQQWDEHTVGEWLKSVNCGKYRQMFAKNNINGDALLDCDQNILKEVGVTKVGDRIRILVAVKALRARAMSLSKVNPPFEVF